ncbi:hypothetical protein LINGRAHAP2_LOCUS29152 [Linum grandiflorum]
MRKVGLRPACSHEDMKSLISEIEDFQIPTEQIESYVDDVYDKSILPDPISIPTFGNFEAQKSFWLYRQGILKGSKAILILRSPIKTERDQELKMRRANLDPDWSFDSFTINQSELYLHLYSVKLKVVFVLVYS